MTWDPKAERIEAQAKAATAAAEAAAIRAQTAREDRAAEDTRDQRREERREQRREKRRQERQEARAKRRKAISAVLRGNAVAAVAIGSPEVIAWSGQFGFARNTMKLGFLAPLLPVALEGGALYSAKLALDAIDAGKPAGKYRAATWVQAGVAAAMNFAHGKEAGGAHSAQVGVAYALTSLLGIVLLELTVALKRHKASKRSGEQIRQGLIRRLRYPVLSAQAASIGAARGIAAEEAWRAAWVDRYGIGPDSTRRERRTARKIMDRRAREDRKAARKGELLIEHGAIVRPGAWITDQALAAWIGPEPEPPSQGVTSSVDYPDIDGPHGAARDASGPVETVSTRPGHIDSDLRIDLAGQDTPADDPTRVTAAIEARRSLGEQTRMRVALHMAAHPHHTVEQIAAALGLSPKTVTRHRTAIRQEAE